MAMSICTGLKQQAGDGMGEKKERGRFTLRFNEGDPIHEAAIGLQMCIRDRFWLC